MLTVETIFSERNIRNVVLAALVCGCVFVIAILAVVPATILWISWSHKQWEKSRTYKISSHRSPSGSFTIYSVPTDRKRPFYRYDLVEETTESQRKNPKVMKSFGCPTYVTGATPEKLSLATCIGPMNRNFDLDRRTLTERHRWTFMFAGDEQTTQPVFAEKDAVVYAGDGTTVYAHADSRIEIPRGNRAYPVKSITVPQDLYEAPYIKAQGLYTRISAKGGSRIYAGKGSLIHASQGTKIFAVPGAKTFQEQKANCSRRYNTTEISGKCGYHF